MLSHEFGALPSTMEAEIESSAALDSAEKVPQKKDVYTYTSQYPLYSAGWTCRPDRSDRLAVGTIIEEYSNKVSRVFIQRVRCHNRFSLQFLCVLIHVSVPCAVLACCALNFDLWLLIRWRLSS